MASLSIGIETYMAGNPRITRGGSQGRTRRRSAHLLPAGPPYPRRAGTAGRSPGASPLTRPDRERAGLEGEQYSDLDAATPRAVRPVVVEAVAEGVVVADPCRCTGAKVVLLEDQRFFRIHVGNKAPPMFR